MVELKEPGAAAAAKTTLDPVKLDSKHYKVVIDNDQVRVLRANYGPHEKSVMHEHPASVAVFVSDGHVKFTLPDGTSQDNNVKADCALQTKPRRKTARPQEGAAGSTSCNTPPCRHQSGSR